jgi:hypothetical protein
MRAPSTRTSVCVEFVPRVKSDVCEPGVRACTTSRPGTGAGGRRRPGVSLLSISSRVMTVTAEPTSFSSSGTEVAVTTTDSDAGGTC